MSATRTSKRSRSGAAEACPVCSKKLRGGKGMKAHMLARHGGELAKAVTEAVAFQSNVMKTEAL